MDKGAPPTLFVNDGSFMERFKQLQQEKVKEDNKNSIAEDSKSTKLLSPNLTPTPSIGKNGIQSKANDARKTSQVASGGKLAFSLKQKSKLVTPVKLGGDDDEDETEAGNVSSDAPVKRKKLDQLGAREQSPGQLDVGNCSIFLYTCTYWITSKSLSQFCSSFLYFDVY